jgi:hypothetical protein
MRMLMSLAMLLSASATASAADLTTIDRNIKKEPTYNGKPKYCLLVFGPEAKTRVWLVLDGADLYVDRNGNGELMRATNRVEIRAADDGSVCATLTLHRQAYVQGFVATNDLQRAIKAQLDKNGDHVLPVIEVFLKGKVRQQAWPPLGARPQDAPVVHFDGRKTLETYGRVRPALVRGGPPTELRVSLATPGLGYNSVCYWDYDEVPKDKYPFAEIEFPPAAGGNPTKTRVVFKERC